jgi:enoyl-CoA hydratase/carnithine racemase
MSDPLLYEQYGKIVLLTLNRPSARNALGGEIVEALVKAIDRINNDASVSCLILTGAGEAFCAGGDVKEMHQRKGMFGGSPAEMRSAYIHGIQRIPTAMHGLEIPAIAAVNGAAIGAGCDLAMMCDLRLASEKATFAESFLRVGLISGDGGAWFLPRVVGVSRAYEMAFTCDLVPAAKAESWGMVSDVVPPDQLMVAAKALAGRIVEQPPQGLRLMKRLIREGAESTLAQTLELSALMQSVVQHTGDHREAVTALIEKRAPHFTGS